MRRFLQVGKGSEPLMCQIGTGLVPLGGQMQTEGVQEGRCLQTRQCLEPIICQNLVQKNFAPKKCPSVRPCSHTFRPHRGTKFGG